MSLEDRVYQQLTDLFSDDFTFNESTFLTTLLKAMEMVESFKELTGPEKKTMVKNLMKKLLTSVKVDEKFIVLQNYYVENDTALDAHIDTLVSVSRGFYNLNKKGIDAFFKKVKNIFSCFGKKTT